MASISKSRKNMPKEKVIKTIKNVAPRKVSNKATTKQKNAVKEAESNPWIWAQSYTSLLLGVVVVIIGVLFVATFIKVKHSQNTQATSSLSTIATPTPTLAQTQRQTYVVKQGDDLWHISEQFYKSGYNYVDIAKANNLDNPGSINAGDKLIIPTITPNITQTVAIQPTELAMQQQTSLSSSSSSAIKTDTYTVQKGDNLWDIALRAYADGYKWTDIAKANNLDNPGMIFSGNILKIPRG